MIEDRDNAVVTADEVTPIVADRYQALVTAGHGHTLEAIRAIEDTPTKIRMLNEYLQQHTCKGINTKATRRAYRLLCAIGRDRGYVENQPLVPQEKMSKKQSKSPEKLERERSRSKKGLK